VNNTLALKYHDLIEKISEERFIVFTYEDININEYLIIKCLVTGYDIGNYTLRLFSKLIKI
jgi:hypothetical protein